MKHTLFLLLSFFLFPIGIYAQEKKTISYDIEAGLFSSVLEDGVPWYLGFKLNYNLNRFSAVYAGANLNFARIEQSRKSGEYTTYSLDAPLMNLNTSIGAKVFTPLTAKIGVMADASFLFSPIPFNLVRLDEEKLSVTGGVYESDRYLKGVYTHFNPTFKISAYLFFKIPSVDDARMYVGYSVSNYNILNSYYRAEVHGVKLKDYFDLKTGRSTLSLFAGVTF
ncbi:hypothetical protein [Bacteroides coprosuis]|uniref:hypothetical protein n=1 Tax=Bacteroides coprosuis TaxID=151276 RepID=UPI001DC7DAD1|nr:hypothetical protein [Bacteroides coprosuis]HJD92292.1 hypothetical protein [Bacteroides coprosuis]